MVTISFPCDGDVRTSLCFLLKHKEKKKACPTKVRDGGLLGVLGVSVACLWRVCGVVLFSSIPSFNVGAVRYHT